MSLDQIVRVERSAYALGLVTLLCRLMCELMCGLLKYARFPSLDLKSAVGQEATKEMISTVAPVPYAIVNLFVWLMCGLLVSIINEARLK